MKFAVFAVVLIFKLVTVYSGSNSVSDASLPSLDVDEVINDIDNKLDEIDSQIAEFENELANAESLSLSSINTAIDELRNSGENADDVASAIAELEEIRAFIESSASEAPPSEMPRGKRQWGFSACSKMRVSVTSCATRRFSCQNRFQSNRQNTFGLQNRCTALQGRSWGAGILRAVAPCIGNFLSQLTSCRRLETCLQSSSSSYDTLYGNSQYQYNSYCPEPYKMFSETDDIYVNGVYVKSAFLVDRPYSYQAALAYCNEIGVSLFTINSWDVQQQFLQFMQKYFGEFSDGSIWINGMRDPNSGYWYSGPYPNIPLFNGIFWKSSYPSGYGDCLAVSKFSYNDPFGIVDLPCQQQNWIYVEYVKPELATAAPNTFG